jgi:PAS domain S-box-containing protein
MQAETKKGTISYLAITLVIGAIMAVLLGLNTMLNLEPPISYIVWGVGSFIGAGLAIMIMRLTGHHSTASGNKESLAALSKSQLKSDFILSSINDGVIVVNAEGNIQYMNPAASKITGWEINDSLSLHHTVVLKIEDKEHKPYTPERNPFQRALKETGPIRDNEAVLETKAGKFISIVIDVSPLLNEKGEQTGGTIGIFRDVSKERLEEAQRAEFISTASHEMRTPVAAIEGYLALAMNDKVSKIDSKARDYLEKAHTSTEHLGKLFQDLLTSAKAEDGRLSSHPAVVEMGEFLEKLVEDLKFAAQKKHLLMEFVLGATGESTTIDASTGGTGKVIRPLYYVHADPDRVREVITNLFDNAVKYTETGKVSLGLTGNNEVVQFYVRDTGPGIPAEDIPHLFQKFYRVDSSATRTIGGTGLGLFISRKIIEIYNGRIWVESKVGQGSTFFINLPRMTTQKAGEMQAAESTNSPAPVPLTPQGSS